MILTSEFWPRLELPHCVTQVLNMIEGCQTNVDPKNGTQLPLVARHPPISEKGLVFFMSLAHGHIRHHSLETSQNSEVSY